MDRIATKLEIWKMSRKLKAVREIREKLENFAKFSGKLKFLVLKRFSISGCVYRT